MIPGQNTPQIGQLVIAQVSKIMPFGAYCKLPEYNNVEVFLPIKEVSSGWIKNIHEFIHEGQKLVCKVIFYDKERQTVDVSLKKVTPKERKEKIGEFNLEKRLEALFLQAIKTTGLDADKQEYAQKITEGFKGYTNFMRNATEGTEEFEKSKLPKKLKDAIVKLLESSRKKKKFVVSYVMTLTTYDTVGGATELRRILKLIAEKGVRIGYISAPKYHLTAEGKDYSDAEEKISSATAIVNSNLKKGLFEIEKEKLKKEKEDIMASL